MFVATIQSGSNGNCVYVEAGGASVLFDAGVSGKRAEEGLASLGRDIRDTQALVISHDHGDHCRSAGIFQRKFGLPIHVSGPTLRRAGERCRLGPLHDVREFDSGESLRFGGMTVECVPTPHDAADGCMFVIEAEGRRLGLMTDLGHVFSDLRGLIGTLDAVVLESNYDPRMLAGGIYPPMLQRRIRGPGGHLSNQEAAELIDREASGRLRWACLAHLSEENNHPRVAMATHRRVLGDRVPLFVASRSEPLALPEV